MSSSSERRRSLRLSSKINSCNGSSTSANTSSKTEPLLSTENGTIARKRKNENLDISTFSKRKSQSHERCLPRSLERKATSCQKQNSSSTSSYCNDANTADFIDNIVQEVFIYLKDGHTNDINSLLQKHSREPYHGKLAGRLESVLFEAASLGNLFVCQLLMLYGVAKWSEKYESSFLIAAQKGHADIMELLIPKCKSRINSVDDFGNTALHLCQNSKSSGYITSLLLAEKIDFDVQNCKGETALMMAVKSLNIKTVIALMNAGANIHLKTKDGDTVSSIASSLGMDGLLQSLVSDLDGTKPTPVMKAVAKKDDHLLHLLLLPSYFEINQINEDGFTPLSIIFNSKLADWKGPATRKVKQKVEDYIFQNNKVFQMFSAKEIELVRQLLRAGASTFKEDMNYDVTCIPFLVALKGRNYKLLKVMADNEENPHYPCHILATAVEEAAKDASGDLLENISFVLSQQGSSPVLSLYQYPDYDISFFKHIINNAIMLGREKVVAFILPICGFHTPEHANKAIITAALSGHYPVFKTVLRHCGSAIDRSFDYKFLCAGIEGNCYEIVKHLLDDGVKAQIPHMKSFLNERNYSLLSNAARILELLFKYGASLTDGSNMNNVYLEFCIEKIIFTNSAAMVDVLLRYGAKLRLGMFQNFLCGGNHEHSTEIRLLFMRHISDGYIDKADMNTFLSAAVHLVDMEFIICLVEAGADVNSCFVDAIKNKLWGIVDFLLEHGADPSLANGTMTPLSATVYAGNFDLANTLVAKGADLDSGNDCLSPLMLAVQQKSPLFVNFLLDHNANINIIRSLRSALSIAVMNQDMEMVKLLFKRGATIHLKEDHYPVLFEAIDKNEIPLVKLLLEFGASTSISDTANNSALHIAAENADGDMICFLVEHHACLDQTNDAGNSALRLAYKAHNFSSFRSLIRAGCNVNVTFDGKTLLTEMLSELFADRKSNFITYLLENKGKTNYFESSLCLHRSIVTKEFDILASLIQSGNCTPMLMDHTSAYCKLPVRPFINQTIETEESYVSESICEHYNGLLSPLCVALLCEDACVAKIFLRCQFVTTSDLIRLPRSEKLRRRLASTNNQDSLRMLDGMLPPPTLSQLSLARVIELIGPRTERKHCIEELEIPVDLKEKLLFRPDSHQSVSRLVQSIDGLRRASAYRRSRYFLRRFDH